MTLRRFTVGCFALMVSSLLAGGDVRAQVGQGLLDLNTISAEKLAELPDMTEALATLIRDQRPFSSIVELHAILLAADLSADQASEIYRKAFIHVNLNTGSSEEILLIPGAGRKMAHEFDEYRPWSNWTHFEREIGKYVDEDEVARLKQYVFIPINLNTASDEEMASIPGVGRRMVHEFEEYRPWKSQKQFEHEIGKYVDATEVARLWRYITID